MKQLTLTARMFVATIITLAAAILYVQAPIVRIPDPWLFLSLFAVSCATATLQVTLPLPGVVSTMSVSYAVDFLSLLLLGWDQTMLVAAGSALCQCAINDKGRLSIHRTVFSVATLIVTVAAAGITFDLLSASAGDTLTRVARPLVGAAAVYFLVNSGLIATVVALASRESPVAVWFRSYAWGAPSYLVGAGVAAIAAHVIHRFGIWVAPLAFAPVYLTYLTYRLYVARHEAQLSVQETSDLHLATIEALAAAIDAKDQMTRAHVRRVQSYATWLAEAVGLSPTEVQAVRTAALLHDIGKLAIPANILSKPGPLTPEEFAKVRIHPQVGAEIIASVPFPYPVAPIILGHHERWDGTGYPQGLKNTGIPIGARIVSLVDYFDVVTSRRPFHAALSIESAIVRIKHEAGRAFDPELVEAFVARVPEFAARFDVESAQRLAAETADLPIDPVGAHAAPDAFENIALAHQEVYALYEIAQAMGTTLSVSDTMTLVSSKLAAIIPWSGCALFVHDTPTDELLCRFASGVDAPLLIGARIRNGEGLSGWVARHRRTLVNASPRIEFESAGVDAPVSTLSAMVCPLVLADRFIGTLVLFHTDVDRYTDDHRRLLIRVGEQAAAVVHNAIVFEQTQEESLTDPLTGLPNRRSMMARLSTEISRSERARSPLAVVVVDVDGFKQVNDSYGHAVGDQVLREIARTLLASLRPYDLCVRFAGDEFVIVLGDCLPDAAEAKRQELQREIEDIVVTVDAAVVRVGVSAGVACYPSDGLTYEALLSAADRRMYSDKSTRRRFGGPLAPAHEWDAVPPAGGATRPAAIIRRH